MMLIHLRDDYCFHNNSSTGFGIENAGVKISLIKGE